MPVDLRAQRAGGELALVRGDFDRDDGVGFDLNQSDPGVIACRGQLCAPLFLVAQVAAIGDDKRSALRIMSGYVGRQAALDDKGDAAALQVGVNVGKTLKHEEVMPSVGLGI